ncbi:hypothetical protein MD484_g3454, partial [Candolleomyces efflorescens]
MDSPFSKHLETGYIASDDEIPHIKALIHQKLDVIGNIDKEIEGAKISLAALEAQRDANKTFVQKHQALITPIKRLPPDILTTVFLTCLPAVELAEASLTCNHPAVVISHVCRQWRQLALNTPMLWSRIRLILPLINYEPYHYPASTEESVDEEVAQLFHSDLQLLHDITVVWFARSKGCPLTIFAEASEGGFVMPQVWTLVHSKFQSLQKLVDLLRGESRRWQQVMFKIAISGSIHESQLSRLLSLPGEDVPILHKATVVVSSQHDPMGGDDGVSSPPSQTALGTLHGQALRSLVLICPKAIADFSVLKVNWGALTELMLRPYSSQGSGFCLTVDEVLKSLKLCPNLRWCNIAIVDRDAPTSPARDPLPPCPVVSLPHLRSLVLLDRGRRTDRLASALDLPSLSSFEHTGSVVRTPSSPSGMPRNESEGESFWYDFPLLGWVQRFGRTITNLDFQHVGVPQRAVELALKELPNLVSLSIRAPFLESLKPDSPIQSQSSLECDSFLKRLTPEVVEEGDTVIISPTLLCPKLEELAMKHIPDSNPLRLVFSEASVVDFVAGRAKASSETVQEASRVSKLRYLSARFSKTQTIDVKQELSRRGCDLEGFVMECDYPDPPMSKSFLLRPQAISSSAMGQIW